MKKTSSDYIEIVDSHDNNILVNTTYCTVDKCSKIIIHQGKDRIDLTQELLDKLLEIFKNIESPNKPISDLFSFEDYEK